MKTALLASTALFSSASVLRFDGAGTIEFQENLVIGDSTTCTKIDGSAACVVNKQYVDDKIAQLRTELKEYIDAAHATAAPTEAPTASPTVVFRSCQDYADAGTTANGRYTIDRGQAGTDRPGLLDVNCEFTNGAGWTKVIAVKADHNGGRQHCTDQARDMRSPELAATKDYKLDDVTINDLLSLSPCAVLKAEGGGRVNYFKKLNGTALSSLNTAQP
jgi:hypothetical protein